MNRPARPAPNPSDESDESDESDKSDPSDSNTPDPSDRADRADPPATPLRPPPPPLSKRRLFVLRLYLAFVLTTGLVLLSSLLESADRLYSHDISFRRQTEALLDGRFALAEDAGAMVWDLAWSANGDQGTVQQVWGLGVPLLRWPFEALARVLGMPAFPDRVCLFLLLGLMAYALLGTTHLTFPAARHGLSLQSVLLAVLFLVIPPFLGLCRSRFLVYEEAAAYGYAATVLLLCGFARYVIRPSTRGLLGLSVAAGMLPLIRPTFAVYSVMTVLLAALVHARRPIPHKLRTLFLAGGALSLGFGFLLYTNTARFGHPLEFGHSLNVNGFPAMMHATRFGHPYAAEPLHRAAMEFGGMVFCMYPLGSDGDGYYTNKRFPGQSPTFRWRELYIPPFHPGHLLLAAAAAAIAIGRVARTAHMARHRTLSLDLSPNELLSLWALGSLIPLCAFYLRFPCISSRYFLDLAPAIAVIVWVFWSAALNRHERPAIFPRIGRRTAVVGLLVWISIDILYASRAPIRHPRTLRAGDIAARMRFDKEHFAATADIPHSYTNGYDFSQTRIQFNGLGWHTNGLTDAGVALYVEDPAFLELEVAPALHADPRTDPFERIQAKIGLEPLTRRSITPSGDGAIVTFDGPQSPKTRTGVQVAFLSFVHPHELDTHPSNITLKRVSWRTDLVKGTTEGTEIRRVRPLPPSVLRARRGHPQKNDFVDP